MLRVSRRHSAQDIAGTTRAAYLATEVSVRVPGSGWVDAARAVELPDD
jgi:hypothetical protein